jgi:hypothetical protein
MIFALLIDALLLAAFLLASCLLVANVVLGVLRIRRAAWRDGALLLVSATCLGVSLSCVPRIVHCVLYGIQSKAASLSQWGLGVAMLALVASIPVRGRAKWSGIAGSIVVLCLILFAVHF